MTPQDQQLIEGLIARARPLASPPDPEAERLLGARLAAEPALAAALVRRVAQLEASLADAQQRLSALPAPASGGGSFLGGAAASVFGGPAPGPTRSPFAAPPQPAPPAPPPAFGTGAPAYAPDPGPGYAPQPAAPAWGGGGGGGGFLRGAAQTATGVAGGMLAAEAVEGLAHQLGWGQHHPDGFFGGSIPPAGTAPEQVIVNNYDGKQPPADDTAQASDAWAPDDQTDDNNTV